MFNLHAGVDTPVQRELGVEFRLEEWVRESHQTPFGTVQEFGYQRFTRAG